MTTPETATLSVPAAELDELRRLSEAATPGEWRQWNEDYARVGVIGEKRPIGNFGGWDYPHKKDDGAGDQRLAVAAVNFVRDIIAQKSAAPVPPQSAPAPTRQMAEGCCSAVSPCAHQKREPYSICDVCQQAAALNPTGDA